MTLEEGLVLAWAQWTTCDGCGDVDYIGCERMHQHHFEFDVRSRSEGFRQVWLWEGHPWQDKHLCHRCRDRGAHHVESIPLKPDRMLRARIYEVYDCPVCKGTGELNGNRCQCRGCQGGKRYGDKGRGLQLPYKPLTEQDWSEQNHIGLVLAEDKKTALPLARREDHWVPMRATMALSYGVELINETYIVLLETSAEVMFPTVYEIKVRQDFRGEITTYLTRDVIARRYGEQVAERIDDDEALEVSLRVPMEILQ